ncbi:MAG: hypothetical protein GC162_20530 [Planctomycetes bacterium]|nr:hypothetical protein [Planctomycetota bacterium]
MTLRAGDDHLTDLLSALVEGTIDDAQLAELDALLAADEKSRLAYIQYVDAHAELRRRVARGHGLLIPGGMTPARHPKRKKYNAVALLLIGVVAGALVSFVWLRSGGSHEATSPPVKIVAAADAAWVKSPARDALTPGRWRLAQGIVELQLSSEKTVIIDAPADFDLGDDGLTLHRGRISGSTGLSIPIVTPHGQLAAAAGRWGLIVAPDGATQVHAIDHPVDWRTGAEHVRRIDAGRCLRLGATESMTDADEHRFLQYVPTARGPSLAGRRIDLPDMVGGGCGLGNGRLAGISITDGRIVTLSEIINPFSRGKYLPVAELPFVDGVFMPDPKGQLNIVSTTGVTTEALPPNSGHAWGHVWNGPQIGYDTFKKDAPVVTYDTRLNTVVAGTDYSQPGHSLLNLHANKAVTFDLAAVRDAYPGVRIVKLTAVAADAEITLQRAGRQSPRERTSADVWVLVDGRMRFSRRNINALDGAIAVSVDLSDGDRFLTLAATDGGNGDGNDWTLFADAVLHVEPLP